MTIRAATNLSLATPVAIIRSANMTLTTDQLADWQIPVPTAYVIDRVLVRRMTGAFGTACAGGLYTTTAKGGSALVAAGQSYAALTGAGKVVDATLAAIATSDVTTSATLYLSLTTGNTGALTADVLIYARIIT